MRKAKKFMAILLVAAMLVGCGNQGEGSGLEERTEENGYENSESEDVLKETKEEYFISEESAEKEYTETNEEYLKRMEGIYCEIKDGLSKTDKAEILFNGISWGDSFALAEEKFPGMAEMVLATPISPGNMIGIKTRIDERLSPFSNANNIGGYAYPLKKEMKVAGYDVDVCMLLFSAVEKEEEYILTNENSALYAARYEINPADCENAKKDLKEKISSIYGEPDAIIDTSKYNAKSAKEYIYWYGANDTVLVLTADSGGMITISYVWLGGEELLNAALDNAEKSQNEKEAEVYGDGDTSGL